VGFFAPDPPRPFVSVWRPVIHDPVLEPLIHFEVLMTITPSTQDRPNLDNFRWSVYNRQGDRLFSLDFDNYFLDVSYQLDGNSSNVVTDRIFTNDVPLRLELFLDLLANQWSARIDGETFLDGLPMTTTNAPLNLGDIDAVWAIYNTDEPGDNFMVFDDYRITAATTDVTAARLELLGTFDGAPVLRLYGPNECRYAIESTTDNFTWTPLKTNLITGGYADWVDGAGGGSPMRLYRARFVP
jgi:hypothetical protein